MTTGLHDSQVQYWEPAKWVAKLRDIKQGNSLLLLETNMNAGHGGKSGVLMHSMILPKNIALFLCLKIKTNIFHI